MVLPVLLTLLGTASTVSLVILCAVWWKRTKHWSAIVLGAAGGLWILTSAVSLVQTATMRSMQDDPAPSLDALTVFVGVQAGMGALASVLVIVGAVGALDRLRRGGPSG